MYPLCIRLEIVLVSLFLGLEKMFNSGVYVAVGITSLMTGYCVFASPYLLRSDNVRLIVYRCSVSGIMVLQTLFK